MKLLILLFCIGMEYCIDITSCFKRFIWFGEYITIMTRFSIWGKSLLSDTLKIMIVILFPLINNRYSLLFIKT